MTGSRKKLLALFSGLLNLKAETTGGAARDRVPTTLDAWGTTFFQTLEYLAFLHNEDLIHEKPLVRYFEDSIVDWYERVFVPIASKDD